MDKNQLIIHTDGGAKNNPGPAGIGIVFCDRNHQAIAKYKKYIGHATNNQAEYQAVIWALKLAQEKYADYCLNLLIDSQLIVNQLNGQYKLKNEGLKPLHQKVKDLQGSFRDVSFKYIPREENEIADDLVKKAYKNH